jgi:hypothetical protein
MSSATMEQYDAKPFVASPLFITIGLTYLALMLASGFQALDPFVRSDDYPALLADPSGFYIKTLREGRWVNYWWHLRGWVSPAWLNYAVYQFLWAIFAGAAAINACGKKEHLPYIVGLSILIALGIPSMMISLWFNTLLPGMALMAIFALAATYLKPSQTRLLLLVFVPLTLMAYTTYPFLLLAICLTSKDLKRSWRDLLIIMVIFVISFIIGLLLIYSLNYIEHGVFGIELAKWREPTRAHDLTSLISNLSLISVFAKDSIMTFGFEVIPLVVMNGVVLVGSICVVLRAKPLLALYIFTGILTGLSLICLQIALHGIAVPTRSLEFVWMLYCVLFLSAVIESSSWGSERYTRIGSGLLIFSVVFYFSSNVKNYLQLTNWQTATKELAVKAGNGMGPIYVTGSYKNVAGAEAADIQRERGLRSRLTYLTEREVYVCDETPDTCANLSLGGFSNQTLSTIKVQQFSDRTEIYIPALVE